nr:vicilin-like seed storage protein At2g18540 [Lolium perenne]
MKVQANKLLRNKVQANKLQANKPQGGKLLANKLQGNKLQVNKPHGNKLQGNKPQGINHNGDKLQGMATQPTKGKEAWEGNDKEESVWEEALRTVQKKEKEELERKRQEEIAKKKAEDDHMQRGYEEYLLRHKRRNEKLQAERDRLWREKFQRNMQLAQPARERANRIHLEEVAKEAKRMREERAQAEASKTEERHHFFDSV